MLPAAFQMPAGVVLVAVGLLACFAGYRLFRIVLTVYGFVLGALVASSLVPPSNAAAMLVAMVLGGIAGALILFAAYFAGVMLVGAALGAVALHSFWVQYRGTDPNALIIIFFAAVGAAVAMVAQRYVVVAATAFMGAQTAVAGAVAILSRRGMVRPGADDVWVGHLGTPAFGHRWPFYAWLALGALGMLVQLGNTRRRRRR